MRATGGAGRAGEHPSDNGKLRKTIQALDAFIEDYQAKYP